MSSDQHPLDTLRWSHPFADLGDGLGAETPPVPLPDVRLLHLGPAASHLIGVDPSRLRDDGTAHRLGGALLPRGSRPWASLYAGHQFGHWVHQLGDGRACLLGTVEGPDGPVEVQLKGGGPTPYSRGGDGRSVLRSALREHVASEALHALGVPATRSLCLVGSPQPVYREEVETAATVTRIAPTFVRFGHFQVLFARGRTEQLRRLVDHVVDRHGPPGLDPDQKATWLLSHAVESTARMVAHWQAVGFVHGVMNTDNMSILGLTIDHGPYGFMEAFDPARVFNHTDSGGRYAYGRQPAIGLWNLRALAQALSPLLTPAQVEAALDPYAHLFHDTLTDLYRQKLGLPGSEASDGALIDGWLRLLAGAQADYTLSFRLLAGAGGDRPPAALTQSLGRTAALREALDLWWNDYMSRSRVDDDPSHRCDRMNAVNPLYIPRTGHLQRAIDQARQGDVRELERQFACLTRPFEWADGCDDLAAPLPGADEDVVLSCSS